MMKSLIAGALLACAAVSVAPAQVSMMRPIQCWPIAEVENGLAEKFDEQILALGSTDAQSNGFRFYVSPEKKTWTVIMVTPNGLGCMVAAGKDWTFDTSTVPAPEPVKPKPKESGLDL